MSDGGFDPCECYWFNHNMLMQRLMNLLRNSQDSCTDTQCFNELPGPEGAPGDGGFSIMMIMIGWIVVATALFLLRPPSLRRNEGDQKPLPRPQQGNQPPPAPPTQ